MILYIVHLKNACLHIPFEPSDIPWASVQNTDAKKLVSV